VYFGIRFQGWTTNPNQFALFIVVAAAAIALQGGRSVWLRAPFVLAAFVLALASDSDGFRLATLTAVAATATTFATSPRRFVRPGRHLLGLAAILTGFSVVMYKWATVLAVATNVADTGGQASDRIALWKSCVTQIARMPLTGFGPGPHASLPGSTQPIECHNTFLDLGTTSGVLGGLAFAVLIFVLVRRAWRNGDAVAVVCLTTVTTMLLFGFLVRYPQLWLLLALIEFRVRVSPSSQLKPGSRAANHPGHQSPPAIEVTARAVP
jgi:O-antigen ligase